MQRLNSRQRKLIYGVGIVLLLVPIILLGMPATREAKSGGQLARLRTEYKLGESTLGEVDPSSATMNLMLLGLRGIATDVLWVQALEEQKTKDWASMRSTINSIIRLQPHYIKVWRFQGWNLSYNVSAEWDGVADRYYWVKEGALFLQDGYTQNADNPELWWDFGNTQGKKVGRSDEWLQFRRFFLDDPDPSIDGPDDRFNPNSKDNYLAAKDTFLIANEKERNNEQHIMAVSLFRRFPYQSQLDYAYARQREGQFNETTRQAWEQGFEEWVRIYGQEVWDTPGGKVRLEVSTPEEFQELLSLDPPPKPGQKVYTLDDKLNWVGRYQNMTNYPYWRTRALSERDTNTMLAHLLVYEGQALYKEKTTPELTRISAKGLEALPNLEESPEQRVLTILAEARQLLETLKNIIELDARLSRPAFAQQLLVTPDELAGSMRAAALYGKYYDLHPELGLPALLSIDILDELGSTDLGLLEHLTRPQMARLTGMNSAELRSAVLGLDKNAYIQQISQAQAKLEAGLRRFEQLLADYPSFRSEVMTVEEIMMGIIYWRNNFVVNGQPIPADFPLKTLFEENQGLLPELELDFRREINIRE